MGKNLHGEEIGTGLCQRADGRYVARATVNGTKIEIYGYKLSELRKEFEKQKEEAKKKLSDKIVTLADWYKEWFTKCKAPQLKTESSSIIYDRKIRNTFIKLLGNKPIKDITQLDIQEAAHELSQSYADRSVTEAIGVLRECLEIAVVNHIIDVNPCVSIKIKNKNIMKERRVLSHEEQDLFLKFAQGDYYEDLYKIMLSTGMRIGEISALQWEDVDFEKKCIHVRRSLSTSYLDGEKMEELTAPKSFTSYRDIPFFGETEQLFINWKKKQDEIKRRLGKKWRVEKSYGDLVFTTTLGSPITRYNLGHAIDRVVNNINQQEIFKAFEEGRKPNLMESVFPHAFRHTFATRCFEKNMDGVVVQRIMGHSDYKTTLSYTHVLENVLQDAATNVGNFL